MRFYRILFLAIMAIMVIISLITYYSYRQLSDEYLIRANAESIHVNLEQVMYSLEEAEASIRGYLITGDAFYHESLQRSKKDLAKHLDALDHELEDEDDIIDTYTEIRNESMAQIVEMDSLAAIFERDSVFNDEMYRILRAAEERMMSIKTRNEALQEILGPDEDFVTSRTFTPLFIIIGFLVATCAIIYLYSNLYRSLQSNLAAEIQLEKNLIELGQEVQEKEEAEELVEQILDSTDSSVMHIRPVYRDKQVIDFVIAKCNRQTERITGMSKKTLEGSRLLQLLTGFLETGLFDSFVETMQHQRNFRRELLYDYDDLYFYLDVRATPLDDGVVVTSTDITNRIRVQREIEENNQKFSTLFHQAFQFIALIDEENQVTDINESFLQLLGSASDNIIGMSIMDFPIWKRENRELIQGLILRARKTGSARQEVLIPDLDGEERYLDLSCTRVPGSGETRIIFEGRDLTELYWAQEENEFLAHLNVSITNAENFNHAAKLVFNQIGKRYQLDSTEVWVPEGENDIRLLSQYLFDPSKKEAQRKDPYILPRKSRMINRIMKDREMIYVPDIKNLEPDMVQRRDFLVSQGYSSLFAVPIVFEGEVLLIAVFLASDEIEEIDELRNTLKIMSASLGALLIKKKVQDDLKRHNIILNEAERLARLGSWEWHMEDQSLDFSEGIFRILEIRDAVKPDLEEFWQYVHRDDRESTREMVISLVKASESFETDFRLLLDNGKVKYVRTTGHPVRNNFGRINSYTGTMQDITEQKNHEIELHEKNQELLDSNKNLEQFAYIASHDLQEPLRKIRAFGGRLEQKYQDILDEKGIDYLNRMQNAASRMQVLINDLLKYSRVARNVKPFEVTSLNQVVAGVLTDLEATIQERKATVEVAELPEIFGDELQLRQLCQNLISNAVKFVPEGRKPKISIWAEELKNGESDRWNGFQSDQYYCLYFRDNGIGVDQKYKDRIFGLFERLHGRSEYSGTGIGLAICQKVVQNHNGTITLDSTEGEGTTFKVIIPRGIVELEKV